MIVKFINGSISIVIALRNPHLIALHMYISYCITHEYAAAICSLVLVLREKNKLNILELQENKLQFNLEKNFVFSNISLEL